MSVTPATYARITDWAHLRDRYIAFWDKRVLDHAIIAHIQNPNPTLPVPEPWMLEERDDKYLDPKRLFELNLWRRTPWNWHADLFKYTIPSYGPNVFTGFCGGRPVFGADTVWHEPVIDSLDEADRIHFDEDNHYWKLHLETAAYFVDRCAGELQLGTTDFGGPTDWISALMGTENFLLAVIEQPERMRDFALRLAEECNHAFDIVYPILSAKNDGIANWMPCWSDRCMGTVQDDMAINFSPEMYAEVFLPAIRCMAAHTEHTVLHWHSGCAHHLDNILTVDEIDLIQYGHDPNSPPFPDDLPYMQKIQAAGKHLFISCVEAKDAEFFISNLDPRGLMMIIDTESDEASARMADDVACWTARRMEELGIL
ncbi:MAG: hypothetical protein ACYDBB_14240 [Armatimonadota bacterium]